MSYPFNLKSEKDKRRKLRNDMPQPEKVVWYYLRKKQLRGYKFRRQSSIGKFIVDFYCPKIKLAIELDGDSHYLPKVNDYDLKREKFIKQFGIKIIRFTNKEINESIEGVIDVINASLPPLTPPKRRGMYRFSPIRGD